MKSRISIINNKRTSKKILNVLKKEDGLILRGGCALAFMVILAIGVVIGFFIGIFGGGWGLFEGCLVLLIINLIINGIIYAVNSRRRRTDNYFYTSSSRNRSEDKLGYDKFNDRYKQSNYSKLDYNGGQRNYIETSAADLDDQNENNNSQLKFPLYYNESKGYIFCTYCGAKLPDYASYCSQCGKKLKKE